MAGRRTIAALLIAAFLRIAGASHHGPAQPPGTARIHIRLVDLAELPGKIRAAAEGMAADVFRRSGIEIDFIECLTTPGSPCREPGGQADFWLQILKQRPDHLHRDSAGFAILVRSDRSGDSYAAVSYPMVAAAARNLEAPVAEVLGASLAHELGHLVLHSSAHSRVGIMSPRLDRRQIRALERGELLFTADETARLRKRAAQLAP